MIYPKIIFLLAFIIFQTLFCIAQENVAANGEFEDSELFPSTHPYLKSMVEKNWAFDPQTRVPKGWIVNPIIYQGEFRYVADEKEAHSPEHFIRLKGDLYQTTAFNVRGGDKLLFSFWAKASEGNKGGRGAFAGFYVSSNDEVGSADKLSFSEKTTEVWTKYSRVILVPESYQQAVFNIFIRAYELTDFDDIEVILNPTE